MLNYVMVCMLEDGLSSPATISRIVAGGKTILTQAAGSSILAFGHAYGAYQEIGKRMDGIPWPGRRRRTNRWPRWSKRWSNGTFERPPPRWASPDWMLEDPMAKRMIARAEKVRCGGQVRFIDEGDREGGAETEPGAGRHRSSGRHGRRDVRPRVYPRGDLGVLAVTRASQTGAHYCEEIERRRRSAGQILTPKEWYDGPEDRPVPTLEERKKVAKAMEAQTPESEANLHRAAEDQGVRLGHRGEIDDPRRKI